MLRQNTCEPTFFFAARNWRANLTWSHPARIMSQLRRSSLGSRETVVVVKIEAQVRILLHEWKGQARCISRPTGAPSYISHSPGFFFQKILRTDLGIQLIQTSQTLSVDSDTMQGLDVGLQVILGVPPFT